MTRFSTASRSAVRASVVLGLPERFVVEGAIVGFSCCAILLRDAHLGPETPGAFHNVADLDVDARVSTQQRLHHLLADGLATEFGLDLDVGQRLGNTIRSDHELDEAVAVEAVRRADAVVHQLLARVEHVLEALGLLGEADGDVVGGVDRGAGGFVGVDGDAWGALGSHQVGLGLAHMHPTTQPFPRRRRHQVGHHVVGPGHLDANGTGDLAQPGADGLQQLGPALEVAHGAGLGHLRQRFLDGFLAADAVGAHLLGRGLADGLVGAPDFVEHRLDARDQPAEPAVERLVQRHLDELVGAADVVGHQPHLVRAAEVDPAHAAVRGALGELCQQPRGQIRRGLHHVELQQAIGGQLLGQGLGGCEVDSGAGGGGAGKRYAPFRLFDHHHARMRSGVDRQTRVHEAAFRQLLIGAANALQPLAELGRALVLVRESGFAHQGHQPAAGLQQRVGVADVFDVAAVAERRVHDDAVVAAIHPAVPDADQLVTVVPLATPVVDFDAINQRLQDNTTTAHRSESRHDALGAIRGAEHIAIGEELARLHLQEVVDCCQVVALLLQQFAPLVGQFDHVRLGAGSADAVGDVAHACARFQHRHLGLDVGRRDHLVGNALRRREEVEPVLGAADHGALERLHAVGFGRLLSQSDELAQRGAKLGRRLQAHAGQLLAALVGTLELPRHRNPGTAAVGTPHLLDQFRTELGAQGDALVAVALPDPARNGLARAHDDGPLAALDAPGDGLAAVAAAGDGTLGAVLGGECRAPAFLVAVDPDAVEVTRLLHPGRERIGHVVGHLHQLLANLLGAVHLQQLASQRCQVGAVGGEGRELGVVGRLRGRGLALAFLLLGVARVLGAQFRVLGVGDVGLQQRNLGLGADAVQELGRAVGQRLRDVAHGLGGGLGLARRLFG